MSTFNAGWDSLCPDLLLEIFRQLSLHDIYSACKTCKAWASTLHKPPVSAPGTGRDLRSTYSSSENMPCFLVMLC